ncbi:hypothetical protein [Negadavirga shengliensis]|uniref:Uncharacterized protein n=1 Tax=Negadavirga shengliensis TaxID=1389218 RepID=A0ABV9SZC2_9BACT
MKNKLLFLPDIFFVLLLIMSCERASLENLRNEAMKSSNVPGYSDFHFSKNNLTTYQLTIEKQVFDWEKLSYKAKEYLEKIKLKAEDYQE